MSDTDKDFFSEKIKMESLFLLGYRIPVLASVSARCVSPKVSLREMHSAMILSRPGFLVPFRI